MNIAFDWVLYRRVGMVIAGVAFAVVMWSLIDPSSIAGHSLVRMTASVLVVIGALKMIILIPIEHRKADSAKILHTFAEAVPTLVVPMLLVMIPYRIYYANIYGDSYNSDPIISSLYEGADLAIKVSIFLGALIFIGRLLGRITR